MYLLHYLQTTHHLSRRHIVALIKQGKIFVNQQKVLSFKHELLSGDSIVFPGGEGEYVADSATDLQ
jgi:RNA-binding protein YlmH